ncbi:hypothetical protein QYE76_002198 [Lolium multiflorum]|uniref:Uncharacterized protein n=1 Tax=Lolium multiflorum TaxID=4521 RepID=A0AAD8RL67_LOLMU|nr:hypothetical protein QYE76_002198 [Lolium multiflorum]
MPSCPRSGSAKLSGTGVINRESGGSGMEVVPWGTAAVAGAEVVVDIGVGASRICCVKATEGTAWESKVRM